MKSNFPNHCSRLLVWLADSCAYGAGVGKEVYFLRVNVLS